MNKHSIVAVMVLLLFGLSLEAQTPLSGTYSINSSGSGDYSNFTDAVSDLSSYGVSSSVTFLIEPGTYNEQLVIPEISGASSTNLILFQGNAADSLSVVLSYAQTSFPGNFVIKLDGADYVSFQYLTIQSTGFLYNKVIVFENGATHNLFSNNHIVGMPVSYNYEDNAVISSSNSNDGYNTILQNAILNGSYGVYFKSTSSSSEYNNIISENLIQNFYYHGVRCDYQYNLKVNQNEVQSAQQVYTYAYGIYTKHMDGPSEIVGNNVQVQGSNYLTGIRTDFSDGSGSNPLLIANNFISQTGINTDVVRAMMIYHGSNQNIYHNSIHVTGTHSSNSRAMFITSYGSSYTGNLKIKNNILVNSGGGFAMYVTYDAVYDNMISECDYNDFFSSGSYFARYSTSSVGAIVDWQTSSGWGSNSMNVNPLFVSDSNLHVSNLALNGTGVPLSEVPLDIDGEVRDVLSPDMGADEFGVPGPLSGTYLIDQNGSGDYTSFTEAVNNAVLLGVDGSVVFEVMPGTYEEKVVIPEISGASENSTITFKSENNDSSSVILTNSVTTYSDNYTLRLDGADYVHIKHISLKSTAWSYARVVELVDDATHNIIANCHIETVPYDSHSNNYAVIFSEGDREDSTQILHNFIMGGSYGVYMKGSSQNLPESGVIVDGNIITSFSARGVLVHFQDHVQVSNNYMYSNMGSDTYDYVYGIYAGFCMGGSKLYSNRVHVRGYDKNYGIYLNYCDGNSSDKMQIYNNSIIQSGSSTGYVYGIYSWSGSHQDISFNSVLLTSGNGNVSSTAMYLGALSTNTNGGVSLYNNNFTNLNGGTAIYLSNTALTVSYVDASDYNNFYFTGAQMAKFGNFDPLDLTTWQLMSTWDSHSLSADPGFLMTDSIHIGNSSMLVGAGLPLNGITIDIDGDLRDSIAPCIGADEVIISVAVTDTQFVSFPQGWSLFSSYIILDNAEVDSVFHPVMNDLIILKDDQGTVYWPPYVFNIDSLELGEGYQVKVDTTFTLPFIGAKVVPESTPIDLPGGWSMFAYYRSSPGNIESIVSGFVNDIVIVKDGNGLIYWPVYGINTIINLLPGYGYQIKLDQSASLTYPPN